MFTTSGSRLLLWLSSTLDDIQRLPLYRLAAFLLFGASLAGLNSLVALFEPVGDLNHLLNLVALAAFGLLWLIAKHLHAVKLATHLFVLVCFAFLNLTSLLSGGINSPDIAWLPLVAIIALMNFGWRWCVIWLVLILIALYVQYLAVDLSWVEGAVSPQSFSVPKALASRLNVLLMVLVSVSLYDWVLSLKREEMGQRNAQLEATQDALRQAQTHKDEFIASVGHELRTPMNAILGLNGVLLSELQDQAQQHSIAQHIRESTEQLLRVVNDILDISQLEANAVNFHPAPCQLRALLHTCTQRVQAPMAAKGLALAQQLDAYVPEWLMLDQRRLEQVLNHLLDNAVKFTKAGQVVLRVSCTATALHVEIQDSGIGMPIERLHNVFSRFEHADLDTHRTYGGTGLGLAICERLVSRQGGQIGLDSEHHVGTRVWFELPLVRADAPQLPAHSQATPSPQGLRVLLVDDNAMNLLVAELMLKTAWRDVVVFKASSGQEALTLLANEAVDLVLMDMVMPDMDGLHTTQLLRQMPGLALLPVIGLTANSQSQDMAHCLASGMNDVLMKPIEAELLYTSIQAQLQRVGHV